MDRWIRGRTALVGDAAACVSLLAGEGTGLAMAEAYIGFRNVVTGLLRIPLVAEMFIGRDLRDDFQLPEYGLAEPPARPCDAS